VSSTSGLNLWMNGDLVGRWWSSRSGEGRLEYAAEWRDSPRGRPLSLSLPFTTDHGALRGKLVENWFENLLPDSDAIRSRIAARHGVDARDTHALLGAIGRDCVGAVQFMRDDEAPGTLKEIVGRMLTASDIAERLINVPSTNPFGGPHEDEDEFRISIAGAQEKTAFLRHHGQWCIPHGATPTTHIFKLPLGDVAAMKADFSTSVENEWLCLELLRAMGLDTAKSTIGHFSGPSGEMTALIVDRFDRQHTVTDGGEWIARLPQEDCCQATGTAADRKYESDGGPGIEAILQILVGSDRANDDIRTFVLAQLAFWLLAAPDGHAKNFSLALRPGGRYRLTPLYDVLSAWPIIGHGTKKWHISKVGLAMGVRSSKLHRLLDKIHLAHWKRLAESTGVSGLFDAMVAMVGAVPSTLATVEPLLPADFPPLVWERISAGMLHQRERFLAALRASATS
jgi:serine/threonine-protein kinase HipA